MHAILSTPLVHAQIKDRHDQADRERLLRTVRKPGPIRWQWWGTRQALHPRRRPDVPVVTASMGPS
jgi:hypothetical protein